MTQRIEMFFGAVGSIALMVLALWCWQHAGRVVADMTRPELAVWAVRCAAVCVAAAAQAILLTYVVGYLYRRDFFDEILKLAAVLVFAVAAVSAIVLGLAGR